jgi:ABC-type oligopeptide transport system ATPase subunit
MAVMRLAGAWADLADEPISMLDVSIRMGPIDLSKPQKNTMWFIYHP